MSGKFKYSIRYGIITGIVTILYLLIFYFVDKPTMLGGGIAWSTNILFFVGMLFAARETRNELELLSFREALSIAFVTYVVANLFYYDFLYILFNFVDPELLELQKQVGLEAIRDSGMGDMFEEQIKVIEETTPTFSIWQALGGYLQSAIFGFILSLLIGGLTRNK